MIVTCILHTFNIVTGSYIDDTVKFILFAKISKIKWRPELHVYIWLILEFTLSDINIACWEAQQCNLTRIYYFSYVHIIFITIHVL